MNAVTAAALRALATSLEIAAAELETECEKHLARADQCMWLHDEQGWEIYFNRAQRLGHRAVDMRLEASEIDARLAAIAA